MGWLMGIRGLTFSWKRALGITNLKRLIASATGIPTTFTGLFAKLGRLLMNGVLLRVIAWAVLLCGIAPDIWRKIKKRR